jgi:hypothetical protein
VRDRQHDTTLRASVDMIVRLSNAIEWQRVIDPDAKSAVWAAAVRSAAA